MPPAQFPLSQGGGADYAHHIASPLPLLDFQTYLRPRKASLEIHAAAIVPLSILLRKEHMVYLKVLKQM